MVTLAPSLPSTSQPCRHERLRGLLQAHGLLTPLSPGACETRHWGFVQDSVYATDVITSYVTLCQYCAILPDGAAGMAEGIRLAADSARRLTFGDVGGDAY